MSFARRTRGSLDPNERNTAVKYLGYLHGGSACIGVVEGDSVARLTTIEEFYGDPAHWREAEPGGRVPLSDVELVPPVPVTAKILCLGLNYEAHIEETGNRRPKAPNIFARWYASLSCDGAKVVVPSGEPGLDWECELAVIIGDHLVDVPASAAMAGVLGYTCFNDISARTYQGVASRWALGKNADGSGPIGPVVVTADEFGDPYGRKIQTRLNGETKQSSTTDRMIFKIDETIEFITRCTSLRPGDVIATGTPEGVGFRMDPPRLMTAGDIVEIDIEGIGVLTTHIGT
jgi:2-keto-4-pentenoate hydratase/2-oxohepta-3-ene-1,7-dioic acid hydratase in catechol pathway